MEMEHWAFLEHKLSTKGIESNFRWQVLAELEPASSNVIPVLVTAFKFKRYFNFNSLGGIDSLSTTGRLG
eukprot:scaffold172223_cov23-Cyclotella_meneghiniana.AAC.2